MNIVFLGGVFPLEFKNEIEKNSKGLIQNAANVLQWNFISGLDFYCKNLTIITLPFLGSFPTGYQKALIKRQIFHHKMGSSDFVAPFLNIFGLSQFTRYWSAKRELIKWSKKTRGIKWVIVYSLNSPLLKAAIDAKGEIKDCKVCVIVPDLPEYMSSNKNPVYLFLKKIDSKIINRSLLKVDSFVFLTESMSNLINKKARPYVIIEGIADGTSVKFKETEKNASKIVLYTGTLDKRYGILDLLTAFHKLNSSNYKLWICGEGDCKNDIIELSKSDNRIVFFGQLAREQVTEMQQKATVLVNPRSAADDFTKYSFPSKTIEYMLSGTPCIIRRLPGIPEEYYNYTFVPESDSISDLSHTIFQVCEKSTEELENFGFKARDFVLREKNSKVQVKKLYDMLKKSEYV